MARETLYSRANTETYMTGGNIDIVRSELVGLHVSRLNVRISSGLVDEPVSRLDTMIRSDLASVSVSKLDTIVNVATRYIPFQGKII